jgi:transposase
LLLGLKVHAANEHDSRSALRVLERIRGRYGRMKKIYADGGYRGELIEKVKDMLNCDMEITLRTDKSTAFKPLPKRWVVERSFAWLDDFRRLAKDYEQKVTCSENMVYLAFISLMLKWL